jgi:hypothetical protein
MFIRFASSFADTITFLSMYILSLSSLNEQYSLLFIRFVIYILNFESVFCDSID